MDTPANPAPDDTLPQCSPYAHLGEETRRILGYFGHESDVPEVVAAARSCIGVAHVMAASLPDGPELRAGLVHLLEAKDWFERAVGLDVVPPVPVDDREPADEIRVGYHFLARVLGTTHEHRMLGACSWRVSRRKPRARWPWPTSSSIP
ncbi:hypothetical protein ACFZBU_38890 [Embleya sp. NPDC008237]|uniref:hypothetical protein n=1 Tax=Embleya sp. NPDC008237 TaxID=3363978 RepID=UPI0036E71FF6